jgi:serine protease Do
MKKWITGTVATAALALAAVMMLRPHEATAQVPGFLTLEGPGSSIGITVRDAGEEDSKRANLDQPAGVVIESVRAGSPAEAAGFRSGDIVLEFDGERVRSVRQFTRLVRESPPRRGVRAVVVRGTSRQTLTVTPEVTGELPLGPTARLRDFGAQARERLRERGDVLRDFNFDVAPELRRRGLLGGPALGVNVTPLTSQLAEYFGVREGVLVNAVETGSAAAAAGIRAGDVITAVGSRSVRTAADISEEMRRLQPGDSLDVSVTREKQSLNLKAVVPPAGRVAPSSQRRGISL